MHNHYDKIVLDGCAKIHIVEPSEVGIYTKVSEGAYPAYTGDTVVIPRAFEDQTLNTAMKTVYQDITVTEIPYNEVTNPSGGLTVSIG